MRVKDVMSSPVHTCQPDTDLGTVAAMMWEYDCGFIPVVGASGTVAGLVTDRDICIATATRRLAPGHISAAQAMSESKFEEASRRLRKAIEIDPGFV